MLNSLRCVGVGILIGLFLSVAAFFVKQSLEKDATPAESALDGPTETITSPIVVHDDKVKRKLRLPKAITDNKDVKVLGATTLEECDKTVTAIVNTTTGESTLLVRDEPAPLFAPSSRTSVGVAYGVSDGGEALWQATGSYEFARLKSARLGVVGTIDAKGRWFAGVGMRVTW